MKLSRGSNGDIVSGGVVKNARTPNYFQTDLSVKHEIKVKESMRLQFEINALNALNQHSAVAYNEIVIAGSQLISPTRPSRFSGDPQVDWAKVMTNYNYVDALNGKGAFAGVQTPVTLANRYGLPQLFQLARNIRLSARFTF